MMRAAFFLMAWLTVGLLGGCGSTPQASFYTLSSEALRERVETGPAYGVVIDPVTVPEVVDRPQLVLRTASNQVTIAEQARWAEPLKTEIPRVVADNLAQLLEGARVTAYPQRAFPDTAYRVTIDVQRFDSALGDAATVQVSWTVRALKAGPTRSGSIVAREPVQGAGYAALVAAHGRALAAVSTQIADAIRAAGSPKLNAP